MRLRGLLLSGALSQRQESSNAEFVVTALSYTLGASYSLSRSGTKQRESVSVTVSSVTEAKYMNGRLQL